MYKRILREHLSLVLNENKPHKELTPSRIRSDIEAVASVVDVLESVFCIPWNKDAQQLTSLSTGLAATAEVSNDLLQANAKGKNACKDFLTQQPRRGRYAHALTCTARGKKVCTPRGRYRCAGAASWPRPQPRQVLLKEREGSKE